MVAWIIDLVSRWYEKHDSLGELMISFLKKLGADLAKFAAIAAGVGPIVLPLLGSGKAATVATTAVNDLTSIGQLALQIETAMQGQPGAAKLAALIPLVGNVIKTSELVSGKKIANPELFNKAIQEYCQGTVDLLNSIDQSEAKTA